MFTKGGWFSMEVANERGEWNKSLPRMFSRPEDAMDAAREHYDRTGHKARVVHHEDWILTVGSFTISRRTSRLVREIPLRLNVGGVR